MRKFECKELNEALAHAADGGQSLHLHRIIGKDAPGCFLNAIKRGENIAHLFDLDTKRLHTTAYRLGVRVIVIERKGTPRQHVDLCGKPLRYALSLCEK